MIEDLITGQKTTVRSKYLCGADGAGSRIVRELQLPLHKLPGGGLSINLLVEADMVRFDIHSVYQTAFAEVRFCSRI